MPLSVVTVASGGLPVVDVTGVAPKMGLPVTEAPAGRGIAVTKVAAGGLAVVYASGTGQSGVLTPSFWNTLGFGDRTAAITITTTATLGSGTINNLIDGGFGSIIADAISFTAGQSAQVIKFDFGAGVSKVINGFLVYQNSNVSHGTWVFEGSNDDSAYTDLAGSFALTTSAQDGRRFANSTAYRYYRLRQTVGVTSSAPWMLEIEFSIGDPIGNVRDTLESGDRTATIVVTTTATLGAGTINNLVDGAYTATSADACWFNAGQSAREIKFDLGVGVSKIITGFLWSQNTNGTHGTWLIEASNDDSSYTQLGSSFTLGGNPQQYTFTNTTAYRYYKLRQTAGVTASGPFLQEIEFRMA